MLQIASKYKIWIARTFVVECFGSKWFRQCRIDFLVTTKSAVTARYRYGLHISRPGNTVALTANDRILLHSFCLHLFTRKETTWIRLILLPKYLNDHQRQLGTQISFKIAGNEAGFSEWFRVCCWREAIEFQMFSLDPAGRAVRVLTVVVPPWLASAVF